MTELELLSILARGEDSHHQFKRYATNADSLAAELVALANSGGGQVPRALGAWPKIDLLDEREANQFREVVWRVAAPKANLPVSDPVVQMLILLLEGPFSTLALMDALNLKHRHSFRTHYLRVALAEEWIASTVPDKPNSRLQRYQLTQRGRDHINYNNQGGNPA